VNDADAAGLRHGDGETRLVTVSIAADMIGRCSAISRVSRVDTSTMDGATPNALAAEARRRR